MIQMTSRGDRRQLKDNTEDIHNLQQGDVPTFERVYLQSNIKTNPGGPYMVIGPTDVYGEYYCLKLTIDRDNFNNDSSTSGLKLENTQAPVGPFDVGETGVMGMGRYEKWIATTVYTQGEILANGYQVFVSKQSENVGNEPTANNDFWTEVTVKVFNLNEWIGWGSKIGWEPPRQNPGIDTDGQITELQPKLTHLDLINVTPGGLTGFDVIGTTRLFVVVYNSTEKNEQKLKGKAIREDGTVTEPDNTSGSDKYTHKADSLNDIDILNYSNNWINGGVTPQPGLGEVNANQQWWHASGTSGIEVSEQLIRCTWIKGTWYFAPEIEIEDAKSSTLTTETQTYAVGRVLGKGLEVETIVSSPEAVQVKVDDVTIDFTGSDEIRVKP